MDKHTATRALWLATALTILFTSPVPALAADEVPNLPDKAGGTILIISAPIVTIILSVLVPIVNGILGRSTSKLVPLMTVVFTGLVSLLTTAIDAGDLGNAVFTGQMLLTWLVSFVTALASYYGIWKPYGVTNRGKLGPNGIY
jgi:hypothetical protein